MFSLALLCVQTPVMTPDLSPLLPPCPVAHSVQVHRTEGEPAGPGSTADTAHKTQDRRHSAGQAGPQGPGGGHGAPVQTGSQAAGERTSVQNQRQFSYFPPF